MSKLKISCLLLACAGLVFPAWAQTQQKVVKPASNVPAMVMANHPDWVDNAVIYEVNLRQGTPERNIRGLMRELPRLKDLGVDILWLMPIHPISEKNRKGTLGSYYAVRDYKAVNPEFGTIDDLRNLTAAAHTLGMKVILDEVCNHTGCDNIWVTEHPDYYMLDENGEMFGPFDWTDTYKLNYDNPELRKAMIDNLTFWIKEADIDGYRMDVAGEVPTSFWEEARAELNTLKPVFMLAESSKPELTKMAFEADYNWPMKDMFNAVAATQGVNKYAVEHKQELPKANAQDILKLVRKQRRQYPRYATNMNMVTNHDLNSWEGTEMERYGEGLGAFAVLSYTLPGIPMMYTGQEVGNKKAFEFFELDEVPDYTANDLTAFYKLLNALRHKNSALRSGLEAGSFQQINSSNDNIIAFERTAANGDRVVVVANLSSEAAAPALEKNVKLKGLTNWFSGTAAEMPAQLAPWEYLVFATTTEAKK